MNPQDIILCRRPKKLSVGDVRNHLKIKNDTAKKVLADLIMHRLRDRYITPLENVPRKFKSGFLIMAASCLLIETFQCFKEGKKDTHGNGEGKIAFKSFFKDYACHFRKIDGEEFYTKIRCGILHQAETKGCHRILLTGKIFDVAKKSINASAFFRALKKIVENYVEELRSQDMDSASWTNALKKIEHICDVSVS
jgi:hypothetical protein